MNAQPLLYRRTMAKKMSMPTPPQTMPPMAMPRPLDSDSLALLIRLMMPKMIARAGMMQVQPAGMPMMPRTSEATLRELPEPAAWSEVPSMVKGMPQEAQLLAVMRLIIMQRGQRMACLPVESVVICGARLPAAA